MDMESTLANASVTPTPEVTADSDYWLWVWGTVLPQTVCAIGLVSNLLGMTAIFGRRLYRKAPMFIYFGWLAGVDLIHVIMVACTETNLLYVVTDSSNPKSYTNSVMCKLLTWFNWSTGDQSIILVVVAHAYKLFAMLNPFGLIQKDTTKAVALSCIAVTVITYSLDSHLLWTADITDVGGGHYVCQMGDGYPMIREVVFMYVLIFICGICPILLIILAIAIAIAFWRGYKAHRKLVTANVENKAEAQTSSTYEAAKNSIKMLFPICCVQLVGTLPFGVVFFVMYAGASFDASFVYTVVVLLNHSNYAFNVIMQFIASKFYRNALLGRL